jgi:hypothetical protein
LACNPALLGVHNIGVPSKDADRNYQCWEEDRCWSADLCVISELWFLKSNQSCKENFDPERATAKIFQSNFPNLDPKSIGILVASLLAFL